ncbi:MAG: Peptidase M10A and M12B matrixin and adamalysin [Parcubacteria group bacterium GW2011_GWA2_38_13]|nr:MAG: Peptidase M10A and M12B matrixin and adamalysin [Parcubacteria group bacterium GW2011_GWA2_38_13]
MKRFAVQFFFSLLIVVLFLGFGYYYKDETNRLWQDIISQFLPCHKPITYSIANLDSRFNLTSAELLEYTRQAEAIWETPVKKQLFEYSPNAMIQINFIYDHRQKSTDDLKEMGIVIHGDQSSYDILKAKYDTLLLNYNQKKVRLDAMLASYNADKIAYDKDVARWNARGGALKEEYDALEVRRIDLISQVNTINEAQGSINELVDPINSAGSALNTLIETLNLHVNKYNTIGSSKEKVFDEGEYISNAQGTVINIFQFNDSTQLLRVLAHEFGHALGLEHIDNPKAIMYYLNEGVNEKLTSDDLRAMKSRCKIQ